MAAAAILYNFEWTYLRNSSRSTYIARITRSSLRKHSFLVNFCCIWCAVTPLTGVINYVFTARCTLLQSAVLRSHVVCLSVRLSVTLVNCDHIGWNSSKIISPLVSLGRSLFATPTRRVCSKRNTPKFGPKVTHPLLIWALETFDCILRHLASCDVIGHVSIRFAIHHSYRWYFGTDPPSIVNRFQDIGL